MRTVSVFAVVVGSWLVGFAPAAPPALTRAPLDPPDSVEAVLRRWYVAIGAQDSSGIAAPLAPEFFSFEHTHVKTRAELIRDIMSGVGQGTQSADMKDFRTVVTDSVAWTSSATMRCGLRSRVRPCRSTSWRRSCS